MKKLINIILSFSICVSLFPVVALASQYPDDFDSGYDAGYEDGYEDARRDVEENRDAAKRETEESLWDGFNGAVWIGMAVFSIYVIIQFGKIAVEEILDRRSK